jgi:uncharacterized protein YdaU (DUF1376 family)
MAPGVRSRRARRHMPLRLVREARQTETWYTVWQPRARGTSGCNCSTSRQPAAGRVSPHPLPAPPRPVETHMATDLPWFPMYPADFLVSTATMTPTQGWVYTQMLMYAWTNGAVPDDRAACAAMTRCKLTETDWSVVRARFRKTPAGLVNPRMEQERHAANKRHDLAVKAGRKGASARWSVPDTDRVAMATPSVQNGDPNSSPAMATPMAITITTTTTPTTTPSQPVTVRPTRRGTVSSDVDNRAALRALIAKEQEGRCEDE